MDNRSSLRSTGLWLLVGSLSPLCIVMQQGVLGCAVFAAQAPSPSLKIAS
jgi:hypothetical protein